MPIKGTRASQTCLSHAAFSEITRLQLIDEERTKPSLVRQQTGNEGGGGNVVVHAHVHASCCFQQAHHHHTQSHVCTDRQTHTQTDRQTHTHTHIHTHSHRQTHTHTNTRTHAHKCTLLFCLLFLARFFTSAVIHWGQRESLILAIEFLSEFGDPTLPVVYCGVLSVGCARILGELFPDYVVSATDGKRQSRDTCSYFCSCLCRLVGLVCALPSSAHSLSEHTAFAPSPQILCMQFHVFDETSRFESSEQFIVTNVCVPSLIAHLAAIPCEWEGR